METFSALLALCAGNSPVTDEFPAQRPVTRSFDVFFDVRKNKQLSKQWWGWWFDTPSHPLWRHCDALKFHTIIKHNCRIIASVPVSELTLRFQTTTKHNGIREEVLNNVGNKSKHDKIVCMTYGIYSIQSRKRPNWFMFWHGVKLFTMTNSSMNHSLKEVSLEYH